jgi:hypothetical protein
MCLYLLKGRQVEATRTEDEKLLRDDAPTNVIWRPLPDARDLRGGRYRGFSDLGPQAGIMLLCWDHLVGVGAQQRQAALIDGAAAMQIPPGLLRGRG